MIGQITSVPAVNSAGIPAPPAPMTYQEYVDWVDEDTHAEWADGEVIMASPATFSHQRIIAWFDRILGIFANIRELGQVVPSGFNMKITKTGREPDVLFIRADHQDRIRHSHLEGPADLVIEVVSPDSVERDYKTKRQEYDEREVGEYWLVDPIAVLQFFFQRAESGSLSEVHPVDGVIESAVIPGFRFPVAWIWDPPRDDHVLEWLKIGVSYDKWLQIQDERDAEYERAEAEQARAEAADARADAADARADAADRRANAERARAEALEQKLRELGMEPGI